MVVRRDFEAVGMGFLFFLYDLTLHVVHLTTHTVVVVVVITSKGREKNAKTNLSCIFDVKKLLCFQSKIAF